MGMGAPNPMLVRRASGEPPIGYQPNTYFTYGGDGDGEEEEVVVPQKKLPRSHNMGVRMMNSVRGALYDMQHFSELPPAQSGDSPSHVTWYAVTRDNRLPYLLLLFIMILVIVAVVLGVKKHQRKQT